MKTADRVLELLYDRGENFYLLEELSAAANLTARRLKNALELLQQSGYAVEFSPAQGARLFRPLRLNANLIERGLGTGRIGRNVICFGEVGSTNDVALDSARQSGADGLAVLAESQRRGRGRQGRRWISPSGANILMSVLLIEPRSSQLAHEALTIAAGLALAQGVEDAAGLGCQLKWPNDVLLEGAKVAGVLVEIRRQPARQCLVIGVGINANAAPPAGQVDRPATCLADHLGHPVERIELARAVLRRLEEWTVRIAKRGIEELHAAWLARCGMINHRSAIVCAGKRYVGRVLDISPLEGLTLCCDDGRTVRLPAKGSTVL